MIQGFIFRDDKCVACKACVAACILENSWENNPRTVFSRNYNLNHPLAALNISLACNHCETALCMERCPAAAYKRDELSGAVIHYGERCIGCEYCTWNCPFDAPKIIHSKGIIEKCNLCIHLVTNGKDPACATACPTGALKYGELEAEIKNTKYPWFPETGLGPKIDFSSGPKEKPLKIIPSEKFATTGTVEVVSSPRGNTFPLLIFSFLIAVAVGLTFYEFMKPGIFQTVYILVITIIGGLFSLFHLGRKARAWRALLNPLKSPLSREIAAYLLFIISLVSSGLTMIPYIITGALCSGIILLVTIDSVYKHSGSGLVNLFRKNSLLITGIYLSAFFAGIETLFLTFSALLFAINLFLLFSRKDILYQGIRIFRLLLLILAALFMIYDYAITDPIFIITVIGGEFIGRYMYYEDFETVSISKLITR